MRYGFVLPGGSAPQQLELAVLAEGAGWDGVFVSEAAYGVDPWSILAAMAVRTDRVRLGTMLTPLPWRRPWKLASQVATLDQLSAGRAVLAVGLGAVDDALGRAGEPLDRRERAERLDEALAILRGLWAGDHVRHEGRHYQLDLDAGGPVYGGCRPVQSHIPVWVVAAWPSEPSMARALLCDGLLPAVRDDDGVRNATPDELAQMLRWLGRRNAPAGLDVIAEGESPPDDPQAATAAVRTWAEAGATWWLESCWTPPADGSDPLDAVRTRLAAGPPGTISTVAT